MDNLENQKALPTRNVINWVAVDKKLPNDVTPVLIYSECCEVCFYMQIAELEQGKWFISGTGDDVNVQPTHWAELPKQPC